MTTHTTTPSREEMISAIYEKIADKTLGFGCGFLCKYGLDKNYIKRIILGDLGKEFLTIYPDYPFPITKNHKLFDRVRKDCVLKIIGHPVMIGDVLEWIENNILNDEDIEYQYQYIFRYWLGKHLPITEQSDECVKFVYNLIS